MNKSNIIKLMFILDLKNIVEREGWVGCSCPFSTINHEYGSDKRPSFGIRIGDNSKYHCFACNVSGNLNSLVTSLIFLTGKDLVKARDFIFENEKTIIEPYEKDINLSLKKVPIIEQSNLDRFNKIKYSIRGISKDYADKYNLYFDSKEERLLFPIYDLEKRLVGIRGRYVGKDRWVEENIKYRHYNEFYPKEHSDIKNYGIFYGMQFPLIKDKGLVIVEGEIKTIILKQTGLIHNIWGSMGASITKTQINTLKILNIPLILFFDHDQAGSIARDKVFREIKGFTSVYRITDYCEETQPDEIVKKELIVKALNSLEKML